MDKEYRVDNSFAEKMCPYRFGLPDPKCQADRCAMWTIEMYSPITSLGVDFPGVIRGYCSLTKGK